MGDWIVVVREEMILCENQRQQRIWYFRGTEGCFIMARWRGVSKEPLKAACTGLTCLFLGQYFESNGKLTERFKQGRDMIRDTFMKVTLAAV